MAEFRHRDKLYKLPWFVSTSVCQDILTQDIVTVGPGVGGGDKLGFLTMVESQLVNPKLYLQRLDVAPKFQTRRWCWL